MTARPLHQQYITYRGSSGGGGGEDPDPATYCPANGYELPPDPSIYCPANGYVDPDGLVDPDDLTQYEPTLGSWELILSFQTERSGTFNPSIYGPTITDTDVGWKIDSTVYNTKALSVSLDGSLKTVSLYIKKSVTNKIERFLAGNLNLVGRIDFVHLRWIDMGNITINNNAKLTGFVLPAEQMVPITSLLAQSCNLSGIIDLSLIQIGSSAILNFGVNPNLKNVMFPTTFSAGSLNNLYLYQTGVTGILDLRMFTKYIASQGASFNLYSTPNLDEIIFPTTDGAVGYVGIIYAYSSGIKKFNITTIKHWGANGNIRAYSNSQMTEVSLPNMLAGSIINLHIYSNNALSGVVDCSGIVFQANAQIYLRSNPLMTGVVFPSSVSNAVSQLMLYNNNLIGVLDISMFSAFTTTAQIRIENNTLLTGITFAAAISGGFNNLYIYGCGSLGYINLTPFGTGFNKNSVNINLRSNNWTASIVNKVLYDLDSIISSGWSTSRIITIDGTNSAPDNSSGGFDGIASKASLQAKGFIVNTN